ncbi:MAG: hypothetical protein HY347_04925 [candidate division NC10 bacterium]|nr:hypothetical protein [candidate division NC10 bacterium]
MNPLGGLTLRLSYTITDRFTKEKVSLDYTVELVTTPCHFGGLRYRFVCPLFINEKPCLRRVGKLYLPRGGSILVAGSATT